MFLFEHPAERSPVVFEQHADAVVAHLLVVELLAEELVLFADLGFGAHARASGPTRKELEALALNQQVMKVRGRRECQDCGTIWSYYETGSPRCPECESIHSVGLDDRTRHTDSDVSLDLTPVRSRIDEAPEDELAEDAADLAREYVRKRGFIHAGELEALDWTFVAATELVHVGSAYARAMRPSTDEELYFLELLRNADSGDPREYEDVPDAFQGAYGLAMASATEDYQRDLRTYLADADDVDPEASALSGRIRDHRKRIEALEGDIPPKDAYRLLRATRDLGQGLAKDDPSEFVTADNWLDGIETD